MTELKSCPFCGSPAEVYARIDHVYQESPDFIEVMWIADCTVCNANMELEETQEKAIELWNTRVPDLAMQKREEVLVKALEFYANEENHKFTSAPYWNYNSAPPTLEYPLSYPNSKVLTDRGKIAEAALKSIKE